MGSNTSKHRRPRELHEPAFGDNPQLESSPAKKILLLGSSSSGKSTLLKQIRAISTGEVDDEYRDSWAETITDNVLKSTLHLLSQMDKDGIRYRYTDHLLSQIAYADFIDLSTAEAIRRVWVDARTQQFVQAHRNDALVYDCSEYFLNKVVEIGRLDYRPTDEDILHCKRISTGISVWDTQIASTPAQFYDFGGSRSERRKWHHCFEGASVILFCASLTDYSLVLREDTTESRLTDSLALFEALVNSRWFINTSFMLLLTKSDVFSKQIAQVPLRDFCPDFTAEQTAENGIHYIRNRYMDLRRDSGKKINTFVLDTTNTEQAQRVLSYIPGITPVVVSESLYVL